MSVFLRQSTDLPEIQGDWSWYSVTGTTTSLDPSRRLPELGSRLEQTFENVREEWWALGSKLGQNESGKLAHMPSAASYNCDFGLMLAWVHLTREVSQEPGHCLVVCDDPWLFRQLSELEGVEAGAPPGIFKKSLKAWTRGWLARGRFVLRVIAAHLQLRSSRALEKKGGARILVYGHPGSNDKGQDAYFGKLMVSMPDLRRLLHTDASVAVTRALMADGRTTSLHAWGSLFFTPSLFFQRWRPAQEDLKGPYSWIIRRAVIAENATASSSSNRWQIHCQDRWLSDIQPQVVSWPWENHPWERALCRSARRLKVKTVGYQHAVIGPHQFNPGPASNPDGLQSIPDRIICSGPAYRNQLFSWGIPEGQLCIGGAFRIDRFEGNYFDPDGPVFVATSSIIPITEQMMEAVGKARKPSRKFLIKEHPLYPMKITESDDIQRTAFTIPQSKGISAVFYGTGTSGLEGLLAGVPTYRLRPVDRVAINVLPPNAEAVPVSIESFGQELERKENQNKLNWDSVYAAVDMGVWLKELET